MVEAVLSLPEAAMRYGVTLRTVQAAAERGVLGARLIGRAWITTPAAVERWLADLERNAAHRPGPKIKRSTEESTRPA